MGTGFEYERLPLPEAVEGVAAAARFPAESAWFSGHFPGNPILPGVALIALVSEALVERERAAGRSLEITGVRRVRFRLPVRPGDEVTLEATPMPGSREAAFTFTVSIAGEPACNGVLTARIVPAKNP